MISATSSDYLPTFDGRVAKLMIRRMSAGKGGSYECVAANSGGEVRSSASVRFEGRVGCDGPKRLGIS